MQQGNLERCLRELGCAIIPVTGTSMWPLLQQGRSRVQLAARNGSPLKAGDVVLYRRADGTLVLHRIVLVEGADTCWLCGDHQWKHLEQVHDEQIVAVAQAFFRNGRLVDEHPGWYRLYRFLWTKNLTIRRCCLALLRWVGLEKHSLG